MQALNDTIIGLAAFGTTLAVMTTGQPYLLQGMHPEQMAMTKMEQPFPCLSKQGIVDMGYSAIYPSTDGLVMVSEQGAQLLTEAMQKSQPKGELFSPSTWELGEDWSAKGLAGHVAQGLGSMLPVVAAGAVSGPAGAAAVGGAMAGGEGAEEGREYVIEAANTMGEDGQPRIAAMPEYQRLRREDGLTHEQATMRLAREAETNAGFRQAAVGAVGGAATQKIMAPAAGFLGAGGRATQIAKRGAAGFLEEGTQEALEGVAAKSGIQSATGADLNLAEDSFGNFLLGGLTGGAMGAAGGALHGGRERAETRRVLKPQPQGFDVSPGVECRAYPIRVEGEPHSRLSLGDGRCGVITTQKMPYEVGDRLWVRETWARVPLAGAPETIDNPIWLPREGCPLDYGGPWKPAIHMSRRDSRLTLIVTDVRIERLQQISEADARAEGVTPIAAEEAPDSDERSAVRAFQQLWDQINGPGAWDANPWVVTVSFTVHQRNIDQMETAA